jgi:glycosyltransferase involved in cell wall biosynthesis
MMSMLSGLSSLSSKWIDVIKKGCCWTRCALIITLIVTRGTREKILCLNPEQGRNERKMVLSSLVDAPSGGHALCPLVSIIMPALNEEKTVGKLVLEISSLMSSNHIPFEVIVVDDSSSDKTYYEALRCGAVVLRNDRNGGKGYCLRRGLEKARGDLIVMMDSDGEHLPTDIMRLLSEAFRGLDVVSGSRFMNGESSSTSRIHFVGNQIFNLVIFILTGKTVTDSQTGLRILKRKVIDALHLESDGFEIETEITVKSLKNGFSFKEVPISIRRREYGVSRIRMLSDGRRILRTIVTSSISEVGH